MADITNLEEFLSDVAGSIKTKKKMEQSEKIAAEEFDTAINSIIVLEGQTKTINPSTATQTVIPDQGFNGIISATVNPVTASIDANIQAGNIKKNVAILGVTGTYDGETMSLEPNKNVTPTTSQQVVTPDENYDGLEQVTVAAVTNAIDSNIQAGNIKKNVTILGVTGSLEEGTDTSDATAEVSDLIEGKTAYNADGKITGTIPDNGELLITPSTSTQAIPEGYTSGGTVGAVTSDIDNNIQAGNIKKNVSILGVTGTFEGQEINNQDKTITENGTYQADQGYTGLGEVTVNVPSQEINNQDKTITTNGTYTADAGYTGLGEVTVNVSGGEGDIKLFDTIAHMQADPDAEEGDLALVYREEIQNWQEDTEARVINFPQTVTLPQAFTGNIFGGLRSVDPSAMVDGQVQMSASRFRFNAYLSSSTIRVEYSSSDGTTYTRTQGDDQVDCGTPVLWDDGYGDWDDAVGYFMQTGGNIFEGLYKYATYISDNLFYLPIVEGLPNTGSGISGADTQEINFTRLKEAIGVHLFDSMNGDRWCVGKFNNKYYAIERTNKDSYMDGYTLGVIELSEGHYTLACKHDTSACNLYFHELDLNTYTITNTETVSFNTQGATASGYKYLYNTTISMNCLPIVFTSTGGFKVSGYYDIFPLGATSRTGYFADFNELLHKKQASEYIITDTQLTLNNPNQLLPDVVAYGKKGLITGDGSIYNTLETKSVWKDLLETPVTDLELISYNKTLLGQNKYINNITPTYKTGILATKTMGYIPPSVTTSTDNYGAVSEKYIMTVGNDSSESNTVRFKVYNRSTGAKIHDVKLPYIATVRGFYDITDSGNSVKISIVGSIVTSSQYQSVVYAYAVDDTTCGMTGMGMFAGHAELEKSERVYDVHHCKDSNIIYVSTYTGRSPTTIKIHKIDGVTSTQLTSTTMTSFEDYYTNEVGNTAEDSTYVYMIIHHSSNGKLFAINKSNHTVSSATLTRSAKFLLTEGTTVYMMMYNSGIYSVNGTTKTAVVSSSTINFGSDNSMWYLPDIKLVLGYDSEMYYRFTYKDQTSSYNAVVFPNQMSSVTNKVLFDNEYLGYNTYMSTNQVNMKHTKISNNKLSMPMVFYGKGGAGDGIMAREITLYFNKDFSTTGASPTIVDKDSHIATYLKTGF